MSRRGGSALLTVLFTDMVGSTEIASELGDRRWRELLTRHHHIVREQLRRFGGREIDTAGDGFFATFDRPAQGIRCAWSIAEHVRELGIEIRAGLHVGEAEVMGKRVGGVAVHMGARIGTQAGPGEVLVSSTLRELVPGSGFEFEDRGWRELKGVAEPQRLFAVAAVDGQPRPAPLPGREATRRRAEISLPAPPPFRRRGVLVGLGVLVAVGVVALVLVAREDGHNGAPRTTPANNAVVRVDAQVGRVGKPIPLPPDAALATFHAPDLQIGEGGVWVASGRCLCRIDPSTGEVRRVLSRSLELSFGEVTLGLRAVWLSAVTGGRQPRLIGVDPVTFQTDVETPPLQEHNVFSFSVATTQGSAWLGFRHQLVEFDPHTGDQREVIPLDVTVDGLVSTGRDLWIVDELAQALFRFDPAKGEIGASVTLAGAPDEMAVEPDGTLWVLDELGGTLIRVDPGGEGDAPVNVGGAPVDVAVGGGDLWVADEEDGSVKEIDPVTLEVTRTIDLPGQPVTLGVEPRTGDVWVYLE